MKTQKIAPLSLIIIAVCFVFGTAPIYITPNFYGEGTLLPFGLTAETYGKIGSVIFTASITTLIMLGMILAINTKRKSNSTLLNYVFLSL